MPVNAYLNPGGLIGSPSEQQLLDDLTVESIQLQGMDVQYLPRTRVAYDPIYGEDAQAAYEAAVPIEMYLESYASFQGDGTFMSQMGVEVRDQVVWGVSVTRFAQELGSTTPYGLIRPNEGDLVFYPLNGRLFEIKFVDKFEMHYPLGSLYIWKMTCEVWDYSGQTLATGVPAIDSLASGLVNSTSNGSVTTVVPIDPTDNSQDVANGASEILDFTDGPDVWSERVWGSNTGIGT